MTLLKTGFTAIPELHRLENVNRVCQRQFEWQRQRSISHSVVQIFTAYSKNWLIILKMLLSKIG